MKSVIIFENYEEGAKIEQIVGQFRKITSLLAVSLRDIPFSSNSNAHNRKILLFGIAHWIRIFPISACTYHFTFVFPSGLRNRWVYSYTPYQLCGNYNVHSIYFLDLIRVSFF